MSELAYNIQGERFEPPASATGWRVRRLKPGGRGTPDVVFGSDGAPLIIPIDTELADFRRLVRHVPGRYRLDPVDEAGKACEGGSPAYLQIHDGDEPAAQASAGGQSDLVRDLVRVNSEMVRSISEKFSGVMESAATLLRAADGAGLPQREAPALPDFEGALRNAMSVSTESDDEVGEEVELDGNAKLASVLEKAAHQVMPLVNHTINTKVLGLTPEQSLALLGHHPVSGNAASGSGGAAASSASAANDNGGATPAPESPPPAEEPAAPSFMAHLAAIEQELTPEEARLARRAIGQMPPEALATWREELIRLTPAKAAEKVRAEVKRMAEGGKEAA